MSVYIDFCTVYIIFGTIIFLLWLCACILDHRKPSIKNNVIELIFAVIFEFVLINNNFLSANISNFAIAGWIIVLIQISEELGEKNTKKNIT